MSGEPTHDVVHVAGLHCSVKLACTTCQLVYRPDFADFSTWNTGCPRCGGWTWIAQLDSPECASQTTHASRSQAPDPAVTPPRTPVGSGVPNYVEVIEECRNGGGQR